jgi:hypothetical protein
MKETSLHYLNTKAAMQKALNSIQPTIMKQIPFQIGTHIRKGHERLFQVLIFGNYKKLSGRNTPVQNKNSSAHKNLI